MDRLCCCHSSSPSLGTVLQETVTFSAPLKGFTTDYVFLVIAIVGTTIAPWQLFFQQSCVADKRLRFADLGSARLDTFIGAVFTIVVAGCMMLVGDAATRTTAGYVYSDPAQMAESLGSIFGPIVKSGLLMLMCNAAVLGTTAISLSSAWAYGEVMGWPSSLELKPRQAPGFYAALRFGGLSGGGSGTNPPGSTSTHHYGRSGPGGSHASLSHHLFAIAFE